MDGYLHLYFGKRDVVLGICWICHSAAAMSVGMSTTECGNASAHGKCWFLCRRQWALVNIAGCIKQQFFIAWLFRAGLCRDVLRADVATAV